jgi:ATP synthase, F1 delta subunit
MRRPRLARRYAKAFFEFSQEMDKVEEVYEDIHLINRVFLENKDFRLAICSPIIRVDKKIAIMDAIFKSQVHSIALQYLELILKKRRECDIDLICHEYEKLYKKSKNIVTLYIQSIETLKKEVVEAIREKIKNHLGKEIDIIEQINPGLIGGIRLQFDDYLLDASVKGHINKLRKELVDRSYEINF